MEKYTFDEFSAEVKKELETEFTDVYLIIEDKHWIKVYFHKNNILYWYSLNEREIIRFHPEFLKEFPKFFLEQIIKQIKKENIRWT